MYGGFLFPFFSILIAELLDKSQMAVILLASRTARHLSLFLGVMLAFVVVDGSAIAAGYWVSEFVDPFILRWVSAGGFLIFGILSLRQSGENTDKKTAVRNPFVSGLVLIFLSEWGDKTQIAAGLFATRYDPILVFLGVISALGVLSLLAIYLGKFISKKFSRNTISKISGVVFILTGILIILGR